MIHTAGDRTPFTYLIIHIRTGLAYYGCRYKKGCLPSDLWTVYFTSSNEVKRLIKEEGTGAFKFEVRRTFSSVKECRAWEERVLKRIYKSDKFLNKNCAGAIIPLPGELNPMFGRSRPDAVERMTSNNPMKNKEHAKKSIETRKRKLEAGLIESRKLSQREIEAISHRMTKKNPMQNPDSLAKMRKTMHEKYGKGKNHTSGSVWLANIITKERKRARSDELDKYTESEGWIRLSNKLPIP